MEFIYEESLKRSATIECSEFFSYSENGKNKNIVSVESESIFLYFLCGVLEAYELSPRLIKDSKDHEIILFSYILKDEEEEFEESVGFTYLEEAKERFNSFFGEGEERKAKIAMFLKNEQLFKNIYDLNL